MSAEPGADGALPAGGTKPGADPAGNREAPLTGLPLRAEGVTAGYGGDPVIRGITVSADPGEVVSLVGPNGSGKSTLLKSLVGVIRVSAGTVTVDGRPVTNLPPEEVARASVGYVPQVDDVFPPLTVRENLEMGGYLLPRRQVPERIDRVLAVFPRLARQIGAQLLGLCAEGMTILMVEHELAIMDEFCDPVVVMAEGAVLAEGTMAHLRSRHEVVEAYLVG